MSASLYLRLICYPLLAISLVIYTCNLHPLKTRICKVHLFLGGVFMSLWGHTIITLIQRGPQDKNDFCCFFMNYVVVPVMFLTVGVIWYSIIQQIRDNRKGGSNGTKKENDVR